MNRKPARELQQQFASQNDPLGWFEALYTQAQDDHSLIPWADKTVNPHFLEWLKTHPLSDQGKKALKVGCGLGDDAEHLAQLGFEVTAFDISPKAVELCRQRFQESAVDYVTADVTSDKPDWNEQFDFILEIYTLQVLPEDLQKKAQQQLAQWLKPGGTLLVICRGRDENDDTGQMPWPLTKHNLDHFKTLGLSEIEFNDLVDSEDPPVRRFVATYQK